MATHQNLSLSALFSTDELFSCNMKIPTPKHKVAVITLCLTRYIITSPLSKSYKDSVPSEEQNPLIPTYTNLTNFVYTRLATFRSSKICRIMRFFSTASNKIGSLKSKIVKSRLLIPPSRLVIECLTNVICLNLTLT